MVHRYEVRALDQRGSYVFGASFWASDNLSAIARFGELPIAAPKAELYRGKRRLMVRDRAPPEAEPHQAGGLG